MKGNKLTRDINLESPLSLKERIKARQRFEEQQDREFYEKTGIKYDPEEFTMDNMIKKYEADMKKLAKEEIKKQKMQKEGTQFNDEDLDITDDESMRPDYVDSKTMEEQMKDAYEDEPYMAE